MLVPASVGMTLKGKLRHYRDGWGVASRTVVAADDERGQQGTPGGALRRRTRHRRAGRACQAQRAAMRSMSRIASAGVNYSVKWN